MFNCAQSKSQPQSGLYGVADIIPAVFANAAFSGIQSLSFTQNCSAHMRICLPQANCGPNLQVSYAEYLGHANLLDPTDA